MIPTGRIARRWSWLRDFVLPGGQAVLETIPLYAAIVIFTLHMQRGLLLIYPMLAGLVAVGAWAMRATALLGQRFAFGRIILGCLTAICLVLWVRVSLAPTAAWDPRSTLLLVAVPWRVDSSVDGAMLGLAWFLAICLWCRGLWIGLETLTVQQEVRWFIGGMAVLLLLIAILATTSTPEWAAIAGTMRNVVLLYVFVGLSVLALAHADSLRRMGGAGTSLSWLFAVAVPIALVPLAGFLFSAGAAPAVRETMRISVQIALVLWHVMLWIVYWVLLFLLWLSSLFPAHRGGVDRWGGGPPHRPPPVGHVRIGHEFGVSIFDPTIPLLVLLFGSLAWLLFYLLSRRRQPATVAEGDEERESLWSWSLFLAQLRELWNGLLGRVRAPPRLWPAARRPPAKRPDPTARDIREIYRWLLRDAATLGYKREPASTPVEFARRLAGVIPRYARGIHFVTALYDRARYGETPIDDADLDAAGAVIRGIEAPEAAAVGRSPDANRGAAARAARIRQGGSTGSKG